MIGQTIAHYTITDKLGSGGMGEVYLADDTKLERKVALKFLPESLAQDEEARERLIREAKAASKLSHSNIVTIYAVEQVEDRYFIVMEYVDGRALDEFLSEKPRTLDEILRVAVQMGRALEHAHKAGVVHRDLKPGNIFIDREDRVRILDFGLAILPGGKKLTQTGSTLGTISYMSPEQIEGKDADARSDQFSFGILLYEMLTGQTPFSGDHHAAIMYAILNETPKPLHEFRSDCPPALNNIIMKALQKSPNARYASTSDMVAELRRERDARASGPSQVHIPAPPTTSKIGRVVIPVAVIAALVVILFALKPWSVDISPTQEAAAMADRLAIMYFDNLIEPDDPKRYGEIATNLLITDLSESQHMQIVSSQRLYDLLKLLGRQGQKTVDRDVATQVASKAKAKWMLMGTILQTEPRLVITSQIVESSSGNTIASQKVEGQEGESVFELVGRLAQEVTSDLSIPAPSDADDSHTIEATNSTDAYRHYLNGLDHRRKFYFVESVEEFRKAIAIDTTFAMAYFELYRQGGGSSADMEGWLNRAVKYADRLGRRDRLFLECFTAARTEGWSAQLNKLQDLHREFPDDIEIMFRLSTWYRNNDQPDESIALMNQVIALDSTNGNAYNILAYNYDDTGEFEKSITAINKYIALAPEEANPYDTRGDLYGNHGKFEEAKQSYRRATEVNANFVASMEKIGLLNVLTRDFHAAESCFNAMIAHPNREVRSRGRGLLQTIYSHRGRFHKALDVLDAAIATDRLEQYTGWAYIDKLYDRMVILSALGDHTRERETTIEAYEGTRAMSVRDADWILGYRATVEDKLGNTRVADSLIAELYHIATVVDTSAIDMYYGAQIRLNIERNEHAHLRAYVDSSLAYRPLKDKDVYGKDALARSYLSLSQPAEAIPILQDMMLRFDDTAVRDADLIISLHYDLARAYEMSGWTQKAIERYEHFLDLWQDADPELVLVDSARAHIATLKQGSS